MGRSEAVVVLGDGGRGLHYCVVRSASCWRSSVSGFPVDRACSVEPVMDSQGCGTRMFRYGMRAILSAGRSLHIQVWRGESDPSPDHVLSAKYKKRCVILFKLKDCHSRL